MVLEPADGTPTPSAHTLKMLRVLLLEASHEQKSAILALEAQRLIFFHRAAEVRVFAMHMEKEQLLQRVWWKKHLFLLQASLLFRMVHQRLSHEERRAACGKGILARLELCSPLLRLRLGVGDAWGMSNGCGTCTVVGALAIPLNGAVKLQCRLVPREGDDGKEMPPCVADGIQPVPFVLTYVAGDAALSHGVSRIAYAQHAADGNTEIRVSFPYVSLESAEINSVHTLLITHPRTKHGVVPPLEVPVVVVAPPIIAVENVQQVDVRAGGSNAVLEDEGRALLQPKSREVQACVCINTDDSVAFLALACHVRRPNGSLYRVGIKEVCAEACREYFVGEGLWRFPLRVPLMDTRAAEMDGQMVLRVRLTLSSMPQHVFQDSFEAPSSLKELHGRMPRHATLPGAKNGESNGVHEVCSAAEFADEEEPLVAESGLCSVGDGNVEKAATSTPMEGADEWNVVLSSFLIDDEGVLGVATSTTTSDAAALAEAPDLVWFPHATVDTHRGGVRVAILGRQDGKFTPAMADTSRRACSSTLPTTWALQPCSGASPWWLLRDPCGGCIVLRREGDWAHRASVRCSCFCSFSPPPRSLVRDDSLVEQLFVAELHLVICRMASGRVTCTDLAGESRVLANDGVAACLWQLDDEEGSSLVVLAQHGLCFSIYSLDDEAVVLRSSLQVSAALAVAPSDQQYLGVVPVLGGEAVALWTTTTVELLSHSPSWARRLLYSTKADDVRIMALCPVQAPTCGSDAHCCETASAWSHDAEQTAVVMLLLLSDGIVVGVSQGGCSRNVGHLPASWATPSPQRAVGTLTTDDLPRVASLSMRHVTVENRRVLCICGLLGNHVMRCACI